MDAESRGFLGLQALSGTAPIVEEVSSELSAIHLAYGAAARWLANVLSRGAHRAERFVVALAPFDARPFR